MRRPLPDWASDVEDLAPFAAVRLMAVDLDGTLFRHGDAQISGTIEQLGRTLRSYHYKVGITVATGRALTGVRTLLRSLPSASRSPLVLHNGSVVVRGRDFSIIQQRSIPADSLLALWRIASAHRLSILAYCYEDPLWRLQSEAVTWETVLGWPFGSRIREFNGIPVQWQDEGCPPPAISPCAVAIELLPTMPCIGALREQVRSVPEISCTQSGGRLLEIRPAHSDKAVGVRAAAETLGLGAREVLALGDNDNDAEMLEWAGIGVAVAGATQAALDASDYVCRHQAAMGAIEVLRLVREAKRYFQ